MWAPTKRRRLAVWLLILSFVLGHANVAGYVTGVVSHEAMDAITNYLSWLAITITALDIVVSTDVRVKQEKEG